MLMLLLRVSEALEYVAQCEAMHVRVSGRPVVSAHAYKSTLMVVNFCCRPCQCVCVSHPSIAPLLIGCAHVHVCVVTAWF